MSVGVLIVDDQDDIRLLVRMIVQAAGGGLFVKGQARSGQEALDSLDGVDPDVVLIDEMMPGLTGLETAVRIRERRPDQPIVLFSAHVDTALQRRAESVGIDACVEKGAVELLPDVLRTAVERRAARSPAAGHGSQAAERPRGRWRR